MVDCYFIFYCVFATKKHNIIKKKLKKKCLKSEASQL